MSFSKLRERERKKGGGWREESNGLQLKSIVFDTANKNRREVKALHIKHPPYKHFACVVRKQPPYKHFACVVYGKERKIFGFLIKLTHEIVIGCQKKYQGLRVSCCW
jgi:hypothetical protein